MASPYLATWCALVALAFWTALGLPLARRLLSPTLALPFAPVLGWAVHGVVALAAFHVLPFHAAWVGGFALAMLAVAWAFASRAPKTSLRVPTWAWVAALLLAALCAVAVLPKIGLHGVRLADPIFDHAKVSMIDEMSRLGVPPGNPYIADDGTSGRLAYYVLLHFGAASLAVVLGVGGWEADVAITFFAAFASLAAMMGLATHLARRASAAGWVVLLASTSSARVLLIGLFGGEALDRWLRPPGGFEGWFFQAAWTPQHLISTACVLLFLKLLDDLLSGPTWPRAIVLAIVVAAAFESSIWVGGPVLTLVASAVVVFRWRDVPADARSRIAAMLMVAAGFAIVLAWPVLGDLWAVASARGAGSPIALRPFPVLGEAVPGPRRALDLLAYWVLLLPIQLTATYLLGLPRALRALGRRDVLAIATVVALACAGLLASTLADNNDLAWRSLLLASSLLIVFAATAMPDLLAHRRRWIAALALVVLAAGLPETAIEIDRRVTGRERTEDGAFARAPAVWRAVRAHTPPRERVASNPLALAGMTPWPVNIGWSLLADRRSCYAAWELDQVFTAVPHPRLREIDARFHRVFAGEARPGDVDALAAEHDCATAVITPEDGAWRRDPFRDSASWRAVEDGADVRIYRRR